METIYVIIIVVLLLAIVDIVVAFLASNSANQKMINALKEENISETEMLKKRIEEYEDRIEEQKAKSGKRISELSNENQSLKTEVNALYKKIRALEKEKEEAEAYASSVGNMALASYDEHQKVLQEYRNLQQKYDEEHSSEE